MLISMHALHITLTHRAPHHVLHLLSSPSHIPSHIISRKGLPRYQYVLHPRVTGLAQCLRVLRKGLGAVYDVTIGYPDNIPQGEKDLVTKGVRVFSIYGNFLRVFM